MTYRFNVLNPASSIWLGWLSQLAFLLSLLALFSALVTPASMLAKGLQNGWMAGICSSAASSSSAPDLPDGSSQHQATCELCASLGFVLPQASNLPLTRLPTQHGFAMQGLALVIGAVLGLPFSRGPPVLLA